MLWNPEAETLPRDQLRRVQLERLRATVERVYARVPFYRRRFDEAGVTPGDIRSLEDLTRLPFTRKTDLRDHYPFGLFAVPLSEVVRLHASSGTRGKPTVVGYTKADIGVWAEVVARSIVAAGGRPGDVLHNAYGYGLFTGGLGLHNGAELMGCTVVPMSGGNTQRQIVLLQDFGARVLCCTPSYALNIGETMREMGVPRDTIKLEVGIFGAEPWSEELRAQIEATLGLKARDIYGLSEVIGPGVAMESDDGGGLYLWEDHFLPEIVDPDTGDPLPPGTWGELVFTTLTKEATPVVRYRTGDISMLTYEPGPSGRTHARMGRIKGRSDDMLIVRGVNVFPSEIEAALLTHTEHLAPHYQIVVDRARALDTLEVQVEVLEGVVERAGRFDPAHPELDSLRTRVSRHLVTTLGIHPIVTLQPPRTVPRSEGKAVRVVDKRRT